MRIAKMIAAFTVCCAGVVGLGIYVSFGHTDINGKTGITVDAQGHPIVVAELCHGSAGRVSVYGPNPGNGERNRVDADLRTTQQTASFTLDPALPGSGWDGQSLRLPVTDELHIVIVSGKKSELTQVTFTPQDLGTLQAGTVQYDTYEHGQTGHNTVSVADFHRISCKR